MQYLLSLPKSLVSEYQDVIRKNAPDFFCSCDPVQPGLGSGGGTCWLLYSYWKQSNKNLSFADWLESDSKILMHSGGQSRRLPAYAAVGKVFTPIPVFRWEKGQSLRQNLLDIQMPFYQELLSGAPGNNRLLIASGDVYICASRPLPEIPDADIVCIGMWSEPEQASRHGVFFCNEKDGALLYMMQKPSPDEISERRKKCLAMIDSGIWILSPKAVMVLMQKSGWNNDKEEFEGEVPGIYDFYSEFGLSLGASPLSYDKDISDLSVKILPLTNGGFYHYGTTAELISSTLKIQNRVQDQRKIWHKDVKPHPDLFVQNADTETLLFHKNRSVWVENSHINKSWTLHENSVITGVPVNDWALNVPSGVCIDIVPVGENEFVLRPYGFNDTFSGKLQDAEWMGANIQEWLEHRLINLEDTGLNPESDIQDVALFPVVSDMSLAGRLLSWMINLPGPDTDIPEWVKSTRISANEIMCKANIFRLYSQRNSFFTKILPVLKRNYEKSVFYQVDLLEVAQVYAENGISLPELQNFDNDPFIEMRNRMFRAKVVSFKGQSEAAGSNPVFHPTEMENAAFSVLQKSLIDITEQDKVLPETSVQDDQIIWGRSPIRIDIAGGWTDTPPFCILEGGSVVNMAVDINGQQPLQVFARKIPECHIVLKSIDLGSSEIVNTYEDISGFISIGSPFSIPKAALCLAGFSPRFSKITYTSLSQQLHEFGGGMELTLLSAVPKGSGMGTSSILAATVLGVLSDFCNLNWSKEQICRRTLSLEQLLTTGGGWQDQYGGIIPGIKLLETEQGMEQMPVVKWLPDRLFTDAATHSCMLLYYTGITRTAKSILSEIVKSMFLNSRTHVSILRRMKDHSLHMAEALQKNEYETTARLIARSWEFNKMLDGGTAPASVQKLEQIISDLSYGYKLLGAGGGGYMLIMAKDAAAAVKIQNTLKENPLNNKSKFVSFAVSPEGMRVSRS